MPKKDCLYSKTLRNGRSAAAQLMGRSPRRPECWIVSPCCAFRGWRLWARRTRAPSSVEPGSTDHGDAVLGRKRQPSGQKRTFQRFRQW